MKSMNRMSSRVVWKPRPVRGGTTQARLLWPGIRLPFLALLAPLEGPSLAGKCRYCCAQKYPELGFSASLAVSQPYILETHSQAVVVRRFPWLPRFLSNDNITRPPSEEAICYYVAKSLVIPCGVIPLRSINATSRVGMSSTGDSSVPGVKTGARLEMILL